MSIALENRVAELETLAQTLIKQVEQLNQQLTRIEARHKPGPKPKPIQAPPVPA